MLSTIIKDINDATIQVFILAKTNVGGFLVESRILQVEGVDWTRSGTSINFITPPPAGAVVEIQYLSSLLVEVDYAVEVPFNQIDGMSREHVDKLGGLDNSVDVYVGKRIIFARQEQYPGYILEEDGWIQNRNTWDDASGWDDSELGWDNYRLVPGFEINQAFVNIDNERAGVWEITVDSMGLYRLNYVERIVPGQKVYAKYGALYGGRILKYGPIVKFDVGETVPRYRVVGQRAEADETIFDGGSTRFVDNINIYQQPDEGDKYLMFPRVNIFG